MGEGERQPKKESITEFRDEEMEKQNCNKKWVRERERERETETEWEKILWLSDLLFDSNSETYQKIW